MPGSSIGPLLVAAGIVLVVVGLIAWAGGLGWFGRLPGDIRIERDSVRIYIPIVSMLIVSVALSAVLAIIRRLR
ncbi:MAG TPA: DUF2905 domain-containing protein [Gemmatimonadaceae bacterium]|nr:DUF2905 domain-containing protein [Gemmatimonadaceae bacterium]